MTALEAAIKLRDVGPSNPRYGICNNLFSLDVKAAAEFDTFLDVAGYDSAYPVEVNLMGTCKDVARGLYWSCANKWVNAYGAARMQLLNEFINWLRSKK